MQIETLELGLEGWQLHLVVAESPKIALHNFPEPKSDRNSDIARHYPGT